MRICMLISVPVPPQEGIGYYTWNLSRFLMGQGHQVQIITRGERGKPPHEIIDGIPVWRPRFYPVYPFHVHLHGLFVQPLVRHLEREVDLFHLHTPLPPPARTQRPQLLTVHTPMKAEAGVIQISSVRSLLVRAQIPVSVRIENELLGRAGTIASVATSVAQELGEYGLDPAGVKVLGNGVDTDIFCPAEQVQEISPAATYLLAAGRLDLRKGFEDLIEAMPHVASRFPSAKLYIAGTGPLEAHLRSRTSDLEIGRVVQFLGHVDHARMVRLYQDAAIFTHAAHYEGLPTVLLEAMACGTPVIATAVSGALDMVEDGINGLLVPPRAPEAMAGAICKLLNDQQLRARLGMAARRTVEDRFSWQAVGAAYLRCYRALLEGETA